MEPPLLNPKASALYAC